MSTLDDTVKEQERLSREKKLKAKLNNLKLGETLPMGEYAYIQSLGKSGYVYVVLDRFDRPVGVCHFPTKRH